MLKFAKSLVLVVGMTLVVGGVAEAGLLRSHRDHGTAKPQASHAAAKSTTSRTATKAAAPRRRTRSYSRSGGGGYRSSSRSWTRMWSADRKVKAGF